MDDYLDRLAADLRQLRDAHAELCQRMQESVLATAVAQQAAFDDAFWGLFKK